MGAGYSTCAGELGVDPFVTAVSCHVQAGHSQIADGPPEVVQCNCHLAKVGQTSVVASQLGIDCLDSGVLCEQGFCDVGVHVGCAAACAGKTKCGGRGGRSHPLIMNRDPVEQCIQLQSIVGNCKRGYPVRQTYGHIQMRRGSANSLKLQTPGRACGRLCTPTPSAAAADALPSVRFLPQTTSGAVTKAHRASGPQHAGHIGKRIRYRQANWSAWSR